MNGTQLRPYGTTNQQSCLANEPAVLGPAVSFFLCKVVADFSMKAPLQEVDWDYISNQRF